jgi:hypothetical protein
MVVSTGIVFRISAHFTLVVPYSVRNEGNNNMNTTTQSKNSLDSSNTSLIIRIAGRP